MAWQVTIPRAVQLVIDDVGWREGWRLDDRGGPYRAGVDRLLGPADYQAIADLGAALTIRPTAAMILCEWDRENVCARQPTTTQAGAAWDNRARVGDWTDAAAAIFREHAGHLELALHGVGHEHWDHGVMTRAEWYSQHRAKWRWEDLRGHLDCFRAILDQHGLGAAAGHAFPRHFIPCAFQYLWDDADEADTGALVAHAGVQWVSTPFGCLDRRSALAAPDGGLNHGLLVVDRGGNGVPWHVYDTVPAAVMGEVADDATAVLAETEALARPLERDEVELLLARRPAAWAGDRERLVAAHLSLLAQLAQLHVGRGPSAEALLAAGREGLAQAVDSYEGGQGVEFDAFAEEMARQAIERCVREQAAAAAPPALPSGTICGIHWPNLLRDEPAENGLSVDHWTEYLRGVGDQPGQVLAANSREAFAQWAWHTFGRVTAEPDGFTVDLSAVPPAIRERVGAMPVIVEVGAHLRVGRVRSGSLRPVWYRRQGSRAFLAVQVPGQSGTLRFDPARPLQPVVYREGTFNVFDLRASEQTVELDVEVYGTQDIPLAPGFEPAGVEVVRGDLSVEPPRNNPILGVTRLRVTGHDLQGSTGTLRVQAAPRA